MESNQEQKNRPTHPVKRLSDPGEFNRLLIQYGGIFKQDIEGFAKTIVARTKARKNFSR